MVRMIKKHHGRFIQSAQTSYQLATWSELKLVVPLTLVHNGLVVEKRFIFTAGKYDVRVEYTVTEPGR